MATCAVLILSGLLCHQIFRRHETYRIHVHAILLFVPPLVVTVSTPCSTSYCPLGLSFFDLVRNGGIYYAIVLLSIGVYRISPLHPLSRFQGPFWWKLSAFWRACISTTGNTFKRVHDLHGLYGDVVRIGPNELSVIDPTVITALLGSSGINKGPRAMLSEARIPMIGIQDIPEHLRRRRPWARALGPSALKEYNFLISKRVVQLVQSLQEHPDTIIIGDWLNRFSYDLMCDFAFGGGSEMLQRGDEGNTWKLIEEGVRASSLLSELPWLGIYVGHIPMMFEKLQKFLMLGRRLAMKRLQRGSKIHDLFYYLTCEDLPNKPAPPMDDLVDDGILAMVAGSDTVSSCLTSLFACLITHPDTLNSLQEEVDRFYPNGEDACNPQFYPSMPYLHAVINETLRLFPPVPTSSTRKTARNSGGIYAGSLCFPPETSIRIPPWSLHRDARNFSAPYSFWPERWLIATGRLAFEDAAPPPRAARVAAANSRFGHAFDLTAETFVHNDIAFMAFSTGPMSCAGKGFAMQEMRAVVCTILQRFKLEACDGWDPREYGERYKDYYVATRPEVPVRLLPRY